MIKVHISIMIEVRITSHFDHDWMRCTLRSQSTGALWSWSKCDAHFSQDPQAHFDHDRNAMQLSHQHIVYILIVYILHGHGNAKLVPSFRYDWHSDRWLASIYIILL